MEKTTELAWDLRGHVEGERFFGRKVNGVVPQPGEAPGNKPQLTDKDGRLPSPGNGGEGDHMLIAEEGRAREQT